MDTLDAYTSSSEEEGNESNSQKKQNGGVDTSSFQLVPVIRRADKRCVDAAPCVSLVTKAKAQQRKLQQFEGTRDSNSGKRKHGEQRMVLLSNNPTRDVLYEPVQGPANDTTVDTHKHLARYAPQEMQANVAIDEVAFDEQRLAFQKTGRALPIISNNANANSNQELLRTTLGYERQRLQKFAQDEAIRKKLKLALGDVELLAQQQQQVGQTRKKLTKEEKQQELVHGSDDELEYGVWGPPSKQETFHQQNQLTNSQTGDLAPEQLAERDYIAERNRVKGQEDEEKPAMTLDRILERKMAHLLPPPLKEGDKPFPASSTFHGDAEYDYQGRSWMAPPPGLASAARTSHEHDAALLVSSSSSIKCFVPKKCVARMSGGGTDANNKKGIHRIRLFPNTGHLLLSAGLDGICQVWSVASRKCLRTYSGHSAAVRDVQFNSTGAQFVSASFDRTLRCWDTESGQVVQTFGNGKVPYCVQFYPRDDKYFVVGCSDNRIVAYHVDTAELTQEYNHHLAPVNAICFISGDNNEPVKMISSSDDKKILVWEWDVGVPIKYISDPTMHSMPCITLHPSGQYIAGQSLDNTVNCLQTMPKIKLLSKKFSGHIVSGYACELAFSPDGRFLVSGDGTGALFVWDWKRHKILQKYRAHDPGKPCISVVWHPLEPSTLFTASWDGTIKVWQ